MIGLAIHGSLLSHFLAALLQQRPPVPGSRSHFQPEPALTQDSFIKSKKLLDKARVILEIPCTLTRSVHKNLVGVRRQRNVSTQFFVRSEYPPSGEMVWKAACYRSCRDYPGHLVPGVWARS